MELTRHLAMLRGINVGGKNRILMADLKRLFLESGAQEISTFIQSGNVLFLATAEEVTQICSMAKDRVTNHLGKEIPLVIFSASEMEEAVSSNPYLTPEADQNQLFVMFLRQKPTEAQIDSLDPNRSPGDSYSVINRQIYMRLTTGAADTKLTNAYFDSKLKTISTARNWRTVLELNSLLKS
jgi:uncharacterized protein (DUF1697 family)